MLTSFTYVEDETEMDKHVVWRGELYHKTSETASADSLRWAVLMRESVFGPKRLALYRTYSDYTSSVPATFVLNLGDMLHVERNLDPGPPPAKNSLSTYHWADKRHDLSSSPEPPAARHQFTITTEKGVYVFSTRSGDESSFWVGKLNELLHGPPEQGVEYEFPVQVVPTPLSRSLALHGSHVLKVSESDVRIYDASGTTPTSFVCPFSSIEKVDHTASSQGVNPGVISLHCSKVCSTAGGGTITVSTSSSADISRILNHRRMSAVPPSPLHTTHSSPLPTPRSPVYTPSSPLPTPRSPLYTPSSPLPTPRSPLYTPPPPSTSPIATTASYSSSISRTLLQYHHITSLDSKLHPSTTRTRSSPSPTNVSMCGELQHSAQNQQVDVAKSLPPASMILGLRKQKKVEKESSSSGSDSDSDEVGNEIVRLNPRALGRKIELDQSGGGGDFEMVSSWVRHKKGLPAGRVREMDGGFGRINSFPNIRNISGSQDLSLRKKSDHSPGDPSTSLMSSVVRRQSDKRKFAQSQHQLRRSSSLGNSLDLDEVLVKTIASRDKGKEEDAPGSHDLLVSDETYASAGSWELQTPVANGNGDLDSERQTTGDPSLPHYESIKEAGLTRQPLSIDSNPDYDYVRDRILGVRGLPVHHPAAAPYSSDEEEHYYY